MRAIKLLALVVVIIPLFGKFTFAGGSPYSDSVSGQDEACPAGVQNTFAPVNSTLQMPSHADRLGRPTNQGVSVNGFVNLRTYKTIQGLDVSQHQQSPYFLAARRCGAEFVYVRISSGADPYNEVYYDANWKAVVSAGLVPGPYHSLDFADVNEPASHLSQSDYSALEDKNRKYAVQQAAIFVTDLGQALDETANIKITDSVAKAGQFLPIALAVNLMPQARFSDPMNTKNLDRIGGIYRTEICQWITDVKESRFRNTQIILATSPGIYADYHLKDAPCLSNALVWILFPTAHANRQDQEQDPGTIKLVDALCKTAQGDRCIIQNYTNFGPPELIGANSVTGLDLDRFYGDSSSFQRLLQNEKQ